MENSTIWFQTVPEDQTEHDSDQRDAEMGKTMLHAKPRISRIAFFRERWTLAGRPKLWTSTLTYSQRRSTQRPDRQKRSVVASVKVSDENSSLVRSLTLTSKNTMVRERIQIDRAVSEIVSQPLHRDTGIPMDEFPP